MNNDIINDEDIATAQKKLADLQIQAMLFNMDIDIETWSLVPKSSYNEPVWVMRWKEKVNEGDARHEYGE